MGGGLLRIVVVGVRGVWFGLQFRGMAGVGCGRGGVGRERGDRVVERTSLPWGGA